MHVPIVPKPKRPEYDPARDGNPFAWILKASVTARAEAMAAHELQRAKTREAQCYGLRLPQAPAR